MKKIKFLKKNDAVILLKTKNLIFFKVFSKKFPRKQIFHSNFMREIFDF
jgi:hypothetical protein